MSKKSEKEAERQEAIERLRELCPPGTTIYTVLRHVSRSGMSRLITVCMVKDGRIRDLTWDAGKALDWPLPSGKRGIRTDGAGMDMGFHLVHSLSYAIHGMQGKGTTRTPSGMCPVQPTPENYGAGYSLRHEWL